MMQVNTGQEASGIGRGVAPARTVVETTSGPSSGGNTPHSIPATAVVDAASVQVHFCGCSQDDVMVGYFFQRQAGEQLSGLFSKDHWFTGGLDSFKLLGR